MRRSEAARYARWAAGIALILAASVAAVYGYRAWQAAQARKNAPPAVPPTVQQRSAEFSFSKVEQDRTLFTVRASRATEFKERSKSLLEDVWITIYGRGGNRFDNIHTRECDYEPDTGHILCAGDVQIDLESAEEARARLGQRVIHIATVGVSFDRETGEAKTDRPVEFHFPYGHGQGIGVTYSTRDAVIRLQRDVELVLAQPAKPGVSTARDSPPVVLTASRLEYRRNDRTMRLFAPVHVRQGNRELDAASLNLEFDPDLRARRLLAGGGTEFRSVEPGGQITLDAEEVTAQFHREGWVERIHAQGDARGHIVRLSEESRLEAQQLDMEMEPGHSQPRSLLAIGNVKIQSADLAVPSGQAARETRQLETAALRVTFAPGGRQVDRGETLAPAVLEVHAAEGTTRVETRRLEAEFGNRSHLRKLAGRSGVEVARRSGNGPVQTMSSRSFEMRFGTNTDRAGPGLAWTEMEQEGDVRFREGDRTAQADHAKTVRFPVTLVVLSGRAMVADPQTRTAARTITINQRTGETDAEGDVRTTYLAAGRGGPANFAPQPANISADYLHADRAADRAVYSGRARLWQGDAVMEADSLALDRDARRLDGRGSVRALFTQAAPHGGSPEPTLWSVHADTLAYNSGEGRARFEGNVTAQSRTGLIRSPRLDLFLSSTDGGARQLSRALAAGGVTVRSPLGADERHGTAERAEYAVAEGKIVLSGGRPTLFDALRGTTTGHQLTFFLASDRILVDSEEGSRTLTTHRVEK